MIRNVLHRVGIRGATIRGATGTVALGVALALTALGVGCGGGPERATHQPIPGVETPHDPEPDPDDPRRDSESQPRGSDTGLRAGTGSGDSSAQFQPSQGDPMASFSMALSTFVGEIARQAQRQPGPVAVFWPLAKSHNRPGESHVNGLGDLLVDEITAQLEDARLTPISGETLVRDIETTNRNLSYFRDDRDALDLGERLGARYVVYGKVRWDTVSRLGGNESLQVRLWAVDLQSSSQNVAVLRENLTSTREARQLATAYRRPSEVRVGSQARSFAVDTNLEAKINMRLLATRVVRQGAFDLSGKRVVIDPVQIPSTSQDQAEVQHLMRTFYRNYSRAMDRAREAGSPQPDETALAEPFDYEYKGEKLETLESALRVIERVQIVSAAAPSAQLARDLSEELATSLREAGGTFERVAGVTEREAILSIIRSEALDYDQAGAVDPSTISDLEQKGAQVLVRSTLRPGLNGRYDLRVLIHDLGSGRVHSQALGFGTEFTADLDRYLK